MKRVSLLTGRLVLGVVLVCSPPACRPDGTREATRDTVMPPDPATPAPMATTRATEPPVAKRLARSPAYCPGPPPRLTGFGDYGNLAGSTPVWAGFYATFDRAGERYRIDRDAPRTAHGWRIKVLWVVGPELERSARVEGHDLTTRAALWFEVGDEDRGPAPFAILDPANPGIPPTSDGYNEFPSYLYVPQAGCYELETEWGAGRWRLVFGLGR